MNSPMDSMLWKATHRFGVLMVGLVLLFAAWEVAHNEELSNVFRTAGAAVFGGAGVFALARCVRGGKRENRAPAAEARRHTRQRG